MARIISVDRGTFRLSVRELFGVSIMSLHRWMNGKDYPRPTKYSGRNYWSRREVLAFKAAVGPPSQK